MDVLSDCQVHSPQELLDLMFGEGMNTLHQNIYQLRQKLRPHGTDIATIKVNGCSYFQLVRLTASPYNGRR